jgi:hypothetical protein
MRGESENRTKQLKCGVGMDRLSDQSLRGEPVADLSARGGVEPAGAVVAWRVLLVKVAASALVSCRRIGVRLSGSGPNQNSFDQISQQEHSTGRRGWYAPNAIHQLPAPRSKLPPAAGRWDE